jgi:hypothetical protein
VIGADASGRIIIHVAVDDLVFDQPAALYGGGEDLEEGGDLDFALPWPLPP